jgi:hypothetical protein
MKRLFRHCSVRVGKTAEDNHRRSSILARQMHDRRHVRRSAKAMSDNFTIFEGTSEIQRMIIGRAVTGLDVRRMSRAQKRRQSGISGGSGFPITVRIRVAGSRYQARVTSLFRMSRQKVPPGYLQVTSR